MNYRPIQINVNLFCVLENFRKKQKMTRFIKLFCLIACLSFVSIECQPLADARSNYINFFFEMLNPSWRQHRGRIRPFSNQLGSPMLNIRGARDVSKQLEAGGKNKMR
jgi:hypothetical protein